MDFYGNWGLRAKLQSKAAHKKKKLQELLSGSIWRARMC